MEAICPISTRSVISNRPGEPRLSAKPQEQGDEAAPPLAGAPEGVVQLMELSRSLTASSVKRLTLWRKFSQVQKGTWGYSLGLGALAGLAEGEAARRRWEEQRSRGPIPLQFPLSQASGHDGNRRGGQLRHGGQVTCQEGGRASGPGLCPVSSPNGVFPGNSTGCPQGAPQGLLARKGSPTDRRKCRDPKTYAQTGWAVSQPARSCPGPERRCLRPWRSRRLPPPEGWGRGRRERREEAVYSHRRCTAQ